MFRDKIIVLFIFYCVFVNTEGVSQIDPQFSQYMFLTPFINPGSVGIDNNTSISFDFRGQWIGAGAIEKNGSPVTQLLVASTKIKQINSGIGAYIMNETLGPLSNINAKLSYAYHFDVGNGKLGIGLGLGIYYQSIDPLKLIFSQPNDPRSNDIKTNPNKLNYDLNAGIFYQHRKYYVGISSTHLNTPIYNDSAKAFISRQFYLTGGYTYAINELFSFVPSVLVKTDFNQIKQSSLDVTALVKYNVDQLWGGFSYRSGTLNPDAIIAIIGVGLTKNSSLKIGYSFDLTIVGSGAKPGTSHELMLTYSKPIQDILPKPIIRTPRYRF